jgi:hypothetical protein
VLDLGLVDEPAQVDLLAVLHGGEVDEPADDVAHDDVRRLELGDRALELERRARDRASRPRAAARRVDRRQGRPPLRRAEHRDRIARGLDARGHPVAQLARLVERVVVLVTHRR